MRQIPELVNVVLFFAPGLLLVQTLRLGGIGPGLSRHGVGWALIASVPIRWVVELVGLPDLGVEPGLELEVLVLGSVLAVGVIVSLAKRAFEFLFLFGEEGEEQHRESPISQ